MSGTNRPDSSLTCFAFEDDYSFGILQSAAHTDWFIAKCSKLTERLRYTPDSVFDTFPWPQTATKAHVEAVANAAVQLRRVRKEAMESRTGGLRSLYKTFDLPGKSPLKDAHRTLDAAVLAAYGFSPKKDLLLQLLDLNQQVALVEAAGKSVAAPGVPASYKNRCDLVSIDRLGA